MTIRGSLRVDFRTIPYLPYFLTPGSRLLTKEFQILQSTYLIQNKHLALSYENMSQLHQIDPPGNNRIELENQLLRSSFSDSGIWDPEYVKARNSYMMRGPRYKAIISGIRGTLIPDSSDWQEAADQHLNFLDYLDYDKMVNLLFVNSGLKWFMDILTYMATLKFLLIDLIYNIFWKLLMANKYRKFVINRNMNWNDHRADDWVSAVTAMPQRSGRRRTNFHFYDENVNRTTAF